MDHKFLPAIAAIRDGRPTTLEALLRVDPRLATDRSSCSHPTLLQCLVLDGAKHRGLVQIKMAEAVIGRGAAIDAPLIAAASIGNVVMTNFLLNRGASIDGKPEIISGWTPVEESLYWGSAQVTALLMRRGASIFNLRTAAGLGDLEAMDQRFNLNKDSESVHAEAVNSPWGPMESKSEDPPWQQQLDNALSYAALADQREAAEWLMDSGAQVNALPPGFHVPCTALHWAANRGHRPMCEQLIARGANLEAVDTTHKQTPAQWAEHGNKKDVARFLEAGLSS